MLIRKVILMFLLGTASFNAMAEWVSIGGSSDNEVDVYVDITTIRNVGTMTKMWSLTDLKQPRKEAGGGLFQSLKELRQYDCKEEQLRLLAVSFHSENMGAGKVVYSNDNFTNWMAVPPDSIAEQLWKIACSGNKAN